jgi:hypothetical protein
MSNAVGAMPNIADGAGENAILIYAKGEGATIQLTSVHENSFRNDGYVTASTDTLYYLTIERDEGIGTYGTIYVYIYSNSGRTTLVDTLSVLVEAATIDYRYIYGTVNYVVGGASVFTGYTQNLDLAPSGPVVVQYSNDGLIFEEE